MGELEIGNYTKTGSNVEIGQFSSIGDCVWIYINTSLLNDLHPPSDNIVGPVVESFAVIGAHSVIYPGVRVGADSLVGSGCFLTEDLPEGMIAVGSPSKIIGPTSRIKYQDDGVEKAMYPWRFRYQQGYPGHMVDSWLKEVEQLD
jgi:acetyltransferase-like isoleucine patch superfamily enzyme